MRICSLGVDGLGEAAALLEIAGLSGAKANLARYLRCQPRCGWAAVVDDQIIGLVTVLRQGPVGFVGAMAVHPEHRGQRIGRRLLEHAQARSEGITTFLLEATPLGAHLYRRLGYVDEHETVILGREQSGPPPAVRIDAKDQAAVMRLDAIATGTQRDDMLADLLAEEVPALTIHRRGELVGMGMLVGKRLGPVLAVDAAGGRAILDELAPAARNATVPLINQHAIDAMTAHGFTELRRLRRMRLGPPVPAQYDKIWALASPGAG